MSMFNLFRSEMARLMLAGFLVGGLAVTAVQAGETIASPAITEVAP